MRRCVLSIIVALLTFSVSGAYALAVAEPCTSYEQPGQQHGSCPPTCVTCGCCAQAVEPAATVISATPDTPIADLPNVLPTLPSTTPRDILHVPKIRFA